MFERVRRRMDRRRALNFLCVAGWNSSVVLWPRRILWIIAPLSNEALIELCEESWGHLWENRMPASILRAANDWYVHIDMIFVRHWFSQLNSQQQLTCNAITDYMFIVIYINQDKTLWYGAPNSHHLWKRLRSSDSLSVAHRLFQERTFSHRDLRLRSEKSSSFYRCKESVLKIYLKLRARLIKWTLLGKENPPLQTTPIVSDSHTRLCLKRMIAQFDRTELYYIQLSR